MAARPRIGAHCGGGIAVAVVRAREIGAECMQVFASAPQQWRSPSASAADLTAFAHAVSAADVYPIFVHGVYLLNFASPVELTVERSIASVGAYLEWADAVGATGVIVHLGSAGKDPYPLAEDRVVAGLARVLADRNGRALLLLETCAGQGATIGRQFEQLGSIIRRLDGDQRLAVCLDTCHVFAAGYPIHEPDGVDRALDEFDAAIGLDRLACLHVNDSKAAFGSNVDRHANIGEGAIGLEPFRGIVNHPALAAIPLILEVPGDGDGPDRPNIERLKNLRGPE
ncbi:MAG: deoxyribonuclease IV [Chloroflexota bacterium]|nr:MAG: deoxyribonuclease IV [Chloroflexota bacterium]